MHVSMGNSGMNAISHASTTAPVLRSASAEAHFTLAESLARWALCFLAMLAMSGVFAALIANTLH